MNRDEAEWLLDTARTMEAAASAKLRRICAEHDQPIISKLLETAGVKVLGMRIAVRPDECDPSTIIKTNVEPGLNTTSLDVVRKMVHALDGHLVMGWGFE